MVQENISQEFRLKNIGETRNYFLEETNWWVISRKKFVHLLIYIDHFFILASTITGYVLISVFASFHGIPVEIMSSALELEICVKVAAIKESLSQ